VHRIRHDRLNWTSPQNCVAASRAETPQGTHAVARRSSRELWPWPVAAEEIDQNRCGNVREFSAVAIADRRRGPRKTHPRGFRYSFIEIVMSIQLAPDIEAGLRAEAAARGIDVDALIATAIKAYLREAPTLPVPASRHVPSRDRSAEMAWAASPDVQFIGKWVVLEGSHVIASDSNPKRLYEDVRAKGVSSPFLIFVSSDEHEPFAGGWID
jgi:hypothetical protein